MNHLWSNDHHQNIKFFYLKPVYFVKKNIEEIFIFFDNSPNKGYVGGGLIYKIFYVENYRFAFFGILLIACLMIFDFSILNYKNNILITLLILIMFHYLICFKIFRSI